MKLTGKYFLPEVIEVMPLPEHELYLKFKTGEKRVFDCKPLLAKKPFDALLEYQFFNQAHVGLGTVLWSDKVDIAPETLFERSIPYLGQHQGLST
jgi:Protein of unknown function (DUF2442)